MPLCSNIGYNLEALSDPTLSSPHNNIRMLDTEKDPSLLEKRCDSSDLQKRDTGDPSNFRPITLQPVWYKIFASCLKTKMYEFVSANNYIDNHIQKGFWPKVDGVTEHTELLSQIILDAKRKSRGLIVTLLDLKNAFGEVHYDLIRASLNYHHLPSICTDIFNSIYHGSSIFVAVKNESTSQLMVERGSLEGRSMLTAYVQSLFQHPHEDIVQTGIQKSRIHMGPTIQNYNLLLATIRG